MFLIFLNVLKITVNLNLKIRRSYDKECSYRDLKYKQLLTLHVFTTICSVCLQTKQQHFWFSSCFSFLFLHMPSHGVASFSGARQILLDSSPFLFLSLKVVISNMAMGFCAFSLYFIAGIVTFRFDNEFNFDYEYNFLVASNIIPILLFTMRIAEDIGSQHYEFKTKMSCSLVLLTWQSSFKVTVHLERCFQFFVCNLVNTHRLPTNLYINGKLMKLSRWWWLHF